MNWSKRTGEFFLVFIMIVMLAACNQASATPTEEIGPSPTEPGEVSTLEDSLDSIFEPDYDSPPEMTIDPEAIYVATLKTEKGDIVIELLADIAPVTVNNFVFLAREGYYDNTTFHRVIEGFMAQSGDPTGTGAGGPGYVFEDEFAPGVRFDQAGLLAMANGGPGTNGSQFFITYAEAEHLNMRHTIFGRVIEGMDVALALTRRDPENNPDFEGDTLITVEIEQVEQSRLPEPVAESTEEAIVPVPQDGRPLAQLEIADRADLFTGPPEMVIDPDGSFSAVIETTLGEILVELNAAEAPQTVNNFIVLAELGYWDGFPIVFVEPETFILTGSPEGQPASDVGYTIPTEQGLPNVEGAIGFWFRSDLMLTSGSQFYITLTDMSEVLNPLYAPFGVVVEGLDIASQLTVEDAIVSITILQD
jgi:cyclophilin family peptidyl-prolyl cis-trans isomerase